MIEDILVSYIKDCSDIPPPRVLVHMVTTRHYRDERVG